MGHLYRALALAQALEKLGAQSTIYVNDDDAARRALGDRGARWRAVPLASEDTSWERELIARDGIRVWVNDRLETDTGHAQRVISAGARLATLQDQGRGAALAELHIAPLPMQDGRRPEGSRVLGGLQYLVLDPAIAGLRRKRSQLGSVVVSMGGSDTYGLTVEVVKALRARRIPATVVIGPGFAHEVVLSQVLSDSYEVRRGVPSLAQELARHDLAITAGGITPFEANAAGLPCIIVAAEPWEAVWAELLVNLGGCRYAGPRGHMDWSILDSDLPLRRMSEAALDTVPVDGVDRVARELLAL